MTPDQFIAELTAVFKLDAPNPEDFLRVLRRELNDYTGYQLAKGCDEIRRTRRFRNFPTIAETLDAVRSHPREPYQSNIVTLARSAADSAPILRWAERYLADFNRAPEAARKDMERRYPGRAESARAVVKAWSPMNKPANRTPEEKADLIRQLTGRLP